MTTPIVCLDIAGTIVQDDGAVEMAFQQAFDGIEEEVTDSILSYVRDTMGKSKLEVFTALLGDEGRARTATALFEDAYGRILESGAVQLFSGVQDALRDLREMGALICLTTGFGAPTRLALIEELRLAPLIDISLSPADAFGGRGRPAPDMLLSALIMLGGTDVRDLVACGDTTSDLLAGHNAGAGLTVGVTTGAHTREQLLSIEPDYILDSVVELPTVIHEWAQMREAING